MIRFVLRWSLRLLLLTLVVAVGLFLIRDRLLLEFLRHRAQAVSGLDTRLQALETGPQTGRLAVQGLELANPPGFGPGPLITVPFLAASLDTTALVRREIRFHEVQLHVAAFHLIRNARGETNVFQVLDHARSAATPADAVLASPPGFEFRGIDRLHLTLGTLHLVDLGDPGRNRAIVVGITNEVIPGVRSLADLNPLILRVIVRELGSSLGRAIHVQPAQTPTPPRSSAQSTSPTSATR